MSGVDVAVNVPKEWEKKYSGVCVAYTYTNGEYNVMSTISMDSELVEATIKRLKTTVSDVRFRFYKRKVVDGGTAKLEYEYVDRKDYLAELTEKISKSNLPNCDNIKLDKEANQLFYYVHDQWSGTRVSYELDEFGCLLSRNENDSPEQCAGFEEVCLYRDGKEYILSNIADKWTYFVWGGKVYLVLAGYALDKDVEIIDVTKSYCTLLRLGVTCEDIKRFGYVSLQDYAFNSFLDMEV